MGSDEALRLAKTASEVRKDIVRMVGVAKSGPLDMPLSVADLFVYLYWEKLASSPDRSKDIARDRFILGMCDAAPALYAVLARRGYFDREELWHFRRLGALLQAQPDFRRTPGIDAPCVEDGMAIAAASSLAESLIADGVRPLIFCVAHCEVAFTERFELEAKRAADMKLGCVVQILVTPCSDGELPPEAKRIGKMLYSDGWTVFSADGHSHSDLDRIFSGINARSDSPSAVFIRIKDGSGLSFAAEKQSKFVKSMSADEMDQALEELEGETHE